MSRLEHSGIGHPPLRGRFDPAASTGFQRDSAIRAVAAEPAVFLLIMRALAMEVAHPKVGAGVTQHSLFRAQPLRRGWATTDVGLRIIFGDDPTARNAVRQVYRFHDHVHGALPDASASAPAGSRYSAHDAELLLWVWATLVDTMVVAHERWIGGLGSERGDAFYADMLKFATFFGIPSALVPQDRTAFARYLEQMLAGDDLLPTPTSSAMMRQVLWFRHWNAPPQFVRPLRVLAIGTLDDRLVERFDLALSRGDRWLFNTLDRSLRTLTPLRPVPLLRALPTIYLAARRLTSRAA
ncbi:MAG: oxygenase MpaB family protein [Acidimicrobiales bacterium]